MRTDRTTEPYDGYYTRSELEAMKVEATRVERERCARKADSMCRGEVYDTRTGCSRIGYDGDVGNAIREGE